MSRAKQRIAELSKTAAEQQARGDHAAARATYENALRVARASDDDEVRRTQVGILWALGSICADLGDLAAAESHYTGALDSMSPPTGIAMLDELRTSNRAEIEAALAAVRARAEGS